MSATIESAPVAEQGSQGAGEHIRSAEEVSAIAWAGGNLATTEAAIQLSFFDPPEHPTLF